MLSSDRLVRKNGKKLESIGSSIRRLTGYFDKLEKLYGDYNPSQGAFVFTEASEYIDCPVKHRLLER